MRRSLLTLFAALGVLVDLRAGEPPITVSVAVPADSSGKRQVMYRDGKAHFHVVVSNTSDKPQRIWQEWCSWGYFGLTFEFTAKGGKKWVVKKKLRDWTLNFPSWGTLESHESLVLDVHFGDSDIWEGFPRPPHGSEEVTMQAVFDPHDCKKEK